MKRFLIVIAAVAALQACSDRTVYEREYNPEGQAPFEIAIPVSDGNYLVTMELGSMRHAGSTTVKAESRRLCIHDFHTDPGEVCKLRFLVNKRDLNIREDGVSTALVRVRPGDNGRLDWDDYLSLEISGIEPVVSSVTIRKAPRNVITVYLCGDATVMDQDNEPWAGWGQMLPCMFDDGVAVANYAESGERADTFISSGRMDKILSLLQPGDFVFAQFGHNDERLAGDEGDGCEAFAGRLKEIAEKVKEKGANPVFVTPVQRRVFDDTGCLAETHGDYPDGVRAAAEEEGVAVIDLHDGSSAILTSMGPEQSKSVFVHCPAGSFFGIDSDLADDTHFSAFGAYEMAKCVAQEIASQEIEPLAGHVIAGTDFNPSSPDDAGDFTWPLSPYRHFENQKPEGETVADGPSGHPCYLFSYFVGEADGLHLAWSRDGLHWTPVAGGRSLLEPMVGDDKLMRDPSICVSSDGTYHMVWTSSWHDRIIGYASSRDLIHWNGQKAIPVMEDEAGARNCWAPELFYDSPTGMYFIIWATTIAGMYGASDASGEGGEEWNHRLYCTTTRDFKTFTRTRLFFDPGYSVIDAAIVRNPVSGELLMTVKNETETAGGKSIRITRTDNIRKGFPTLVSDQIHGEYWAEGPSPLYVGRDSLIVYYDRYCDGRYGASLSLDSGHTWREIPDEQMSFPEGIRHGTAFKVDETVLDKLLKLK